jgi:hypothetical protein
MEEWYLKQEFFEQSRLDRIKAWTSQDLIDLFQGGYFNLQPSIAV